jgi:hypothetical protein
MLLDADSIGRVTTSEPEAISARMWKPGEAPQVIPEWQIANSLESDVVWVDVVAISDPISIGARLAKHLPGFRPEMASALINPGGGIVNIGADVRLVAWPRYQAPDVVPERSPELHVATLNVLCGPGWLVTFRSRAWSVAGGSGQGKVEMAELIEAGRENWTSLGQTADDLATLWLLDLARSYEHTATRLARYLLNSDHARWSDPPRPPDIGHLRSLAFAIDSLSVQVAALGRPGTASRDAWFRPTACDAEAEAIQKLVEATPVYLDGVRRDVRSIRDQLDSGAVERRVRRFELILSGLAALFLGPGLVGTIFGAFPTWFQNAPDSRAWALLPRHLCWLSV